MVQKRGQALALLPLELNGGSTLVELLESIKDKEPVPQADPEISFADFVDDTAPAL